ncbi:hypothetical protein ACE2PP_004007 [Salmonella enterica]|nr:hypothetical protein [Salmonella enterica subsp. enterica serovar Muenchen]EDU3650652.1 hypothetical protein [Salmonella enterica subsp. enterica serovar Tucson]EIK1667281.1 hypothetical protein [Salmonella enterica]EKP2071426.1 hypothetical protein [Salmonella enterica]EKQ0845025.1 hypothetical protein [Salmonella enterica]
MIPTKNRQPEKRALRSAVRDLNPSLKTIQTANPPPFFTFLYGLSTFSGDTGDTGDTLLILKVFFCITCVFPGDTGDTDSTYPIDFKRVSPVSP